VDLRLDGSEGAAPDAVVRRAVDAVDPAVARRYPDAGPLEARLAARLGVTPERVVVTAGADDAIDRLCRATLAPGRDLVLPSPTFEMAARFARLAGARVVEVPWPDGPFPVDAVLAATGPATSMVFVASPNNPTGTVVSRGEFARLAAGAPQAVICADLVYADYADDDPTEILLALPNVIVVRTMSKAFGLAGVRVGHAAGPAEVVGWMRAAGGPYAVAGISLAMAAARLDDRADVGEGVAAVRRNRAVLEEAIHAAGGRPVASQASFAFARFADARWVRDALAGLGIAVRHFPGAKGLGDALRIAVPADAEGLDRVTRAIAAALSPEAILFDMDGVIADVSRSYRAAVVQTVSSFGVAVSPADVAAAKAGGGAANDWVLCRRLLAARGVDAPLDEVTRRFEALYQGTPDAPGLRRHESLRIDAATLRRLGARVRVGIVTGRPRGDADRFLAEQGIADLPSAMVCMEDGPGKPDPAPVRRALDLLGASRAWMVGDTPDDVRAARAAGVVPIGVPAPGDDAEAAGRALVAAGAGRVLGHPAEVEGLLP
jgi:histidinol-phosphate aminotransferase